MADPDACPCTPIGIKVVSGAGGVTPGPGGGPGSVHIPATPFLKKMGFGTGVSVFLYCRSPSGDEKLRSPWAVKKVNRRHALTQFGQRLEDEARVLRSLSHPNIIGYRGFNKKKDGMHALVMEDGHKALLDIIDGRSDNNDGPFPAKTIENVIEKVASALDYLHNEKQLMHGDLKSGNVLIAGDFDNVKLCDFGVTLPLNSEGRVSEPDMKYVGTEAWCPIEVIKDQGTVTSKADIFAFGLTVFEMLALHSPHVDKLCCDDDFEDDDNDESIDEKAFRAALGTRPSLPDSFEYDQSYRGVLEIFFAATEEDPEKRPSAREILQMLSNSESRDENDDSIMCVNIVKSGDAILDSSADQSSVICIDDSLTEESLTPSAS